jgi:hypothetical protein
MITTANSVSAQTTWPEMPGDPLSAMAEMLTRHGLTVRTTGCDGSRLLKVTGTGRAACDVIVAEDCYFTCEYAAGRDRRTSAANTARIVARMLGADYTSSQRYRHLHRGVTQAGAVGREMKARGMTVTMSVLGDAETYSVFADIVITNPAKPERGKVHIENSGWVYWECYGDEIADGPADLADTVADVLTNSTHVTTRDRLAVVYGARLRAITCRYARAVDADKDS